MKKTVVALVAAGLCGSMLYAQEEVKPTIKLSADLELFYELSKDVGGANDGDKFKSNQLYLNFDGQFDDNMAARVMLDGADIVGADGKAVTEKIIEEANFTLSKIGGSPVSVVFGKDEMPFGLDYDKYLNDSIAHQFEIDKVWGVHGIVDIASVGSLAGALYQHSHSLAAGEKLLDSDNELADNFTAKLVVDKLVKNLSVVLSGGTESYGDRSKTDAAELTTTVSKNDETRMGLGLVGKCPLSGVVVNAEYISFSNKGGAPGYDPGLVTLGLEYAATDKVSVWGRYEIIEEDASEEVETDFWSVGVIFTPAKNYQLLVEYSNFNSGDMSDATDLIVAKGSIEDSLLLGVKARF